MYNFLIVVLLFTCVSVFFFSMVSAVSSNKIGDRIMSLVIGIFSFIFVILMIGLKHQGLL